MTTAMRLPILTALLLVLAGCGEGPPETPDVADSIEGFQLNLGIDRAVYAPGDEVRALLVVLNHDQEQRALSFPTSQRYDLVLRDDADRELWRWSDGMAFAQVLGEERFPARGPGPEWEVVFTAPEAPGTYRLQAEVPADQGELTASAPLEVSGG